MRKAFFVPITIGIRYTFCNELITFIFGFLFIVNTIFSADTLKISPNLYLLKLSDNTFIHVSESEVKDFGKVSSNGMLVFDGTTAALFDTPMEDSITIQLLNYIKKELKLEIKFFIPNHFHDDCTGGMDLLDSTVTIISTEKTLQISLKEKIKPALVAFKENYTLLVGKIKIEMFYPGEGHAPDNMVAFVVQDKILFGGCMIKTLGSKSKGNLSDANLKKWPKSLKKVKKKFKKAEIVIPGHGQHGDRKLFVHTIKVVTAK